MRTCLLFGLVSVLVAETGQAEVVITEVFYDALGGDGGQEWIEIHNDGGASADLTGWSICANYDGGLLDNRTYWFFPAGTMLAPEAYMRIRWRTDGIDSATELFTGQANVNFDCFNAKNLDNALGSISLYDGASSCASFGIPALMKDFVQWGGTTFREPIAVAAGIWTEGDFVPVVGAEGRSIAFDGGGDTSSDWFQDASPTPEEANTAPGDPATANFGAGCTGTPGVPTIASTGGPSALGNQSFGVEAANALPGAPVFFAIGIGSIDVPFFGCSFLVNPLTFFQFVPGPIADGGGVSRLPLPLPVEENLVGITIAIQALIADGAAIQGIAFTDGLAVDL